MEATKHRDLFEVAQPTDPEHGRKALIFTLQIRDDEGAREKVMGSIDPVTLELIKTYYDLVEKPTQLGIKIIMINVSESGEDIPHDEFIRSFPVSAESFPHQLHQWVNMTSASIGISTRRGPGNCVFVHPDSWSALHSDTLLDESYLVYRNENVPVGELFVTYFPENAMDRGWFVHGDGCIVKNKNWDSYGRRIKIKEL
jgi:hypothetical protein